MAKIIVCSAQKGGCAKTVTTHNLSVALSLMGYKVLTVDMDCQANLTTCLGIENVDAVPIGIAHLLAAQLEDEELPEKELYIQHCGLVDLIPASSYLSAVSETMRLEMGSERFLDMILEPLKKDYDFILVDTGPKLDNLNINALVAADQVLIPVNPQFLSAIGLESLMKTIKKVKRRFNPNLEIAGVLFTMCERRTSLCKVIKEQILEEYEGRLHIFQSSIPMTIKVGEAVYYAKSIIEYLPSSPASIGYQNLARELLGAELLPLPNRKKEKTDGEFRIVAAAEFKKEEESN